MAYPERFTEVDSGLTRFHNIFELLTSLLILCAVAEQGNRPDLGVC